MNAKECAIEYRRSRRTNNPVTIRDLAEGNGISQKEIAIEYRKLIDNKTEVDR